MNDQKQNASININGVDIKWDPEKGTFTFFGIPSVLYWIDPSVLHMLKPLVHEIGTDLFKLQVAHSSSLGTEDDYHNMVTVLADNFLDGFLKWGEAVSAAGWGKFSVSEYNYDSKIARVRIENTWELIMQKNEEIRWGCPFVQGKIIGIFTHAFKTNCWATVAEIDYDSDSPYVEFIIFKSDKTIETEIETIRLARMQEKEKALKEQIEKTTLDLKKEKIKAELATLTKSKFLGAMSHEFRTPLNAIIGMTDILKLELEEKNVSSELLNYIGKIEKSSHDMLQLVTQILSYIQISDSDFDSIKTAIPIHTAVKHAINKISPFCHIQEKDSLLEGIDKSLEVVGSPHGVSEIIQVFLSNASKYTPDDSKIEVKAIELNDRIRIEVHDNGKGLGQAHAEKVFEAFERLEHQNSSISGAGVGLTIAKLLADNLNGLVGYRQSELGGACFWVELTRYQKSEST